MEGGRAQLLNLDVIAILFTISSISLHKLVLWNISHVQFPNSAEV